MTSAVKNVNIAVYDYVASIAAGKPLTGSQFFDLKNGGVGDLLLRWVHRLHPSPDRGLPGEDHLRGDQGSDHAQQVTVHEGPGSGGWTCRSRALALGAEPSRCRFRRHLLGLQQQAFGL